MTKPSPTLLRIDVGGGASMSMPAPNDDGSLAWRLTWNEPATRTDCLCAASALESYLYLVLECTKEEAWRRIKLMREAYRDHEEFTP